MYHDPLIYLCHVTSSRESPSRSVPLLQDIAHMHHGSAPSPSPSQLTTNAPQMPLLQVRELQVTLCALWPLPTSYDLFGLDGWTQEGGLCP